MRSIAHPQWRKNLITFAMALLITGCTGVGASTTRVGMVEQEGTGLMFGSIIEDNFVTDSSFYKNKKIKIRTRNTSGDPTFDLKQFEQQLSTAYRSAGYEPTSNDDFGLLVDVNVRYSGQIQSNLSNQYGFLGAAAGGLAGYNSDGGFGAAVGTVAGATLGSIIGSFVTDDTYIIVADVTFGVIKESISSKTITFSNSTDIQNDKDEDDEEDTGKRSFKSTHSTGISVFAGGRNIQQSEISGEVRQRIIRIVSDII